MYVSVVVVVYVSVVVVYVSVVVVYVSVVVVVVIVNTSYYITLSVVYFSHLPLSTIYFIYYTGEIPPLPTTSAKSPNRSSVSYSKGRTSSATTAGGSHTTTTGTAGTTTNRSTIGSANPLHSDGGSDQGEL